MEDDSHNSSNFTLYLILTICLVFLSLDGYELYKTCESWNYSIKLFDADFFENCVKFQIISKITFTIFSFLAAFSSVLITSGILINIDFFINKILKGYVHWNILIFGPYLLGLSILGFFNWEKLFYVCENVIINSQVKRNFSTTIFFNAIACFIISLILTLGFAIYKSFEIYADSITRRDGNKILRTLFWTVVLKFRRREEDGNVLNREENLLNSQNLLNTEGI